MRRSIATILFLVLAVAGLSPARSQSPITVTSALAGKTFYVGDTLHITWTIDESQVVKNMAVAISFDGTTFHEIQGNDEGLPNSTRSFDWPIPAYLRFFDIEKLGFDSVSTVGTSCVVEVREYDTDAVGASGTFAISSGPRPDTDEPEPAKKSGCGSGTGVALIPPVILKGSRLLRRKRLPAR